MREKILFREIEKADDERLARIIRDNLEAYHLDIPGTAYFDDSLDHLIEKPAEVVHSSMDRFYLKKLLPVAGK